MMNRAERRAQWQTICREYRESTESQKAFCRARGISIRTFRYWLAQTRDEQYGSAGGSDLVAVGRNDG